MTASQAIPRHRAWRAAPGPAGIAGLSVLALIWLVPLEAWSAPFPAHMLRHMALVAVAAPLIAIGWPRLVAPLAISPLVAAAIEFVVVWSWHLPAAHGLAWRTPGGFAAEQAAFLVAGLMVWAGALRAGQPLAGAGGLLVTSMHMTALGALLILAPRDLYAEICGYAPNLTAQQAGGLLMLGIGTPVYSAGGLWLVHRALRGAA